MNKDLLKGVRVLDLSQYIPGPYASLQMQKMGAEVIKIEPPGGDPMRYLGTERGQLSAAYQALNKGKQVIELDLKSAAGKQVFERLLADSDVLIEGFRPGVLARLGYTDSRLAQHNIRLVICHLSGYGQQTGAAQRAGHDLGYGARAGLYSRPDGSVPDIVFPPVADHSAALQALAMINAALFQCQRSGRGSVLDISIYGVVADWQYLSATKDLCRQVSGALACYNIYVCAQGGYITLAALEAKFWNAFCVAVNRPQWQSRHREQLPQAALIAELTALFKTRTQQQWQSDLDQVDCCFEVIPAFDEIAAYHA